MQNGKSTSDKKLIIIGFDALSPTIIEPLMKDGKLPNFQRLKQQGSYTQIATSNPSQSPVAWTVFSTGRNPGKNGIFDFIKRDPRTYLPELSLSKMENGKPVRVVSGKCFWQYASEKNIPTTIISCPVTYPPDKINGKMLSGMGVPDILGTEGTFSYYTTLDSGDTKDVGGNIFQIDKEAVMTSHLKGPRKPVPGGGSEHRKVPIKIIPNPGENSVTIKFQNNNFKLEKDKWSDWKNVTFDLGLFKKMKGIVKFFLVESHPDLRLYASPINFDPRAPYFRISHPPRYSKELAEKIGLFRTQGMPFDTWAVNEGRLTEKPFLEQATEVMNNKKAMLDLELNRLNNGLLFCYFESPDIIQHMFWRYIDTEHPLYDEKKAQEYKNIIPMWYKKMDDILGDVLDNIDTDDILIVLSDHGMESFTRSVNLNTWLRSNGYLHLNDPAASSGAELLFDIDWSRTKAYALGFGGIYINQQGREGQGIVPPGYETEKLKEELADKLLKWTDPKNNNSIAEHVYTREDIFWGPLAGETPDLYVGFNKGYRASWQTALGAVPAEELENNVKKWSGTHLCDPVFIPGVLFSNEKITKNDPSLYDITPTVLKISGFSDKEIESADLDGQPLF